MNTPWARQSILFGVALGICRMLYDYINSTANVVGPPYAWLNTSLTAAVLGLLFATGVVGAKKTGTVRAGTYSGLATAAVSVIIGLGTLLLFTFLFMDSIRHHTYMLQDFHKSGSLSMDQFILEDALGAAFFGTFVSLVLGGIVGTAGGLTGARLKH